MGLGFRVWLLGLGVELGVKAGHVSEEVGAKG